MPRVDLKLIGMPAFQKSVRRIARRLPSEGRDRVKEAGELVRKAAKKEAPKRQTGKMRKGIVFRQQFRKSKWIAEVVAAAPHSHLVHDGTKQRVQKTTNRRTGRMPKNPFLDRAVKAKQEEVFRLIGKTFKVIR